MKKLFAILLAGILTLSMAACSDGGTSSPAPSAGGADASASAGGTDASAPAGGEVQKLEAPIAEGPILITSVGQSADADMVKTMLGKTELTFTLDNAATGATIGDEKTLLLVIGGSSKGLGAAGIDADQELARVTELVSAAKEKGLTIIALHIGGEGRRGELSDKFIAPSVENAQYLIVVKDGNKDGVFTKIALEKNIPMDEVDSLGSVITPLQAAFK